MAQASICFVGGSRSHLPFVQAANQLGFASLVFDRNPSAPAADSATRFYPVSTHDTDSIVDFCRAASRDRPIAGCITYSSDLQAMRSQAAVCREFGLTGFSGQAVDLTNDKEHLKKALSKAGIPTPEHVTIRTRSELDSFLAQHREVVAKPSRGGTGSAGVVRIARGSTMTEEGLRTIREQSLDGKILAEAFVRGREFSVDGYVQKRQPVILSIADKYTGVSTKSFAIKGFATSRPDPRDQPAAALEKLSAEVVAALDIDDSLFSIDIMHADGGVSVLDVGLLLDAKIDRLLAIAGLDVYKLLVRLATGQKLSHSAYLLPSDKGYALRFLYAGRKGKLFPRIGYEPDYPLTIEWEKADGDQVQPPASVADTVGWLTAEREDRSSAWKSVAEAKTEQFFQIRE